MKTGIAFVCVAILTCSARLASAGYVYDMENLTVTTGTGATTNPPAPNLRGQDNWASWLTGTSPNFIAQNHTVRMGTGINTSKVGGNPMNSENLNTHVLAPGSTAGILYRQNNANWGFQAFTGTETNATLQFDVTLPPAASPGIKFGLGHYDGINQTQEAGTEWGPMFGFDVTGGSTRFYIRASGAGAESFSSSAVTAIDSGATTADWYQLQLVMDFTANAGAGSGTLYYRNLTDGQATFTAVPGLQNINMALTGGTKPAPNTWDTLIIRVDNSNDTTSFSLYDNLIPNFNAPVPEPSSISLLMLGAGALFGAKRSRNRR